MNPNFKVTMLNSNWDMIIKFLPTLKLLSMLDIQCLWKPKFITRKVRCDSFYIVWLTYLPRSRLPRNVPPRTDMKYPTFIVMTANILWT